MYPVLISIGPVVIYSLSVFIIAAWGAYSFLFWRKLKDEGVDDERIFNLTFYCTIGAFILARLSFVVMNRQDFFPQVLKIAALWVAPGMTFYGALIGAMATGLILAKQFRLRIGLVLDAFAASLPLAGAIGAIGTLLDGSGVGRETGLPWGVSYVGHIGRRHPMELYAFFVFVVTGVILFLTMRKKKGRTRAHGLSGVWFLILVSIGMFLVEFAGSNQVYWQSLTPNQWVSLAVFSEAAGALYVKGGGKEWLVVTLRRIGMRVSGAKKTVYERFTKRISRKDPEQT